MNRELFFTSDNKLIRRLLYSLQTNLVNLLWTCCTLRVNQLQWTLSAWLMSQLSWVIAIKFIACKTRKWPRPFNAHCVKIISITRSSWVSQSHAYTFQSFLNAADRLVARPPQLSHISTCLIEV